MMIFYFCAAMTFISAAVSFGFSIDVYRSATKETLSNAMYAVSRSLALLIAMTVPFIYHVDAYLCAVAITMILVQFFDGLLEFASKIR